MAGAVAEGEQVPDAVPVAQLVASGIDQNASGVEGAASGQPRESIRAKRLSKRCDRHQGEPSHEHVYHQREHPGTPCQPNHPARWLMLLKRSPTTMAS